MATYYKPYMSEDDSTDTESDGYTSEESLLNTPGKLPPVEMGVSAKFGENTSITHHGAKFEVKESRNTTLFMINSRDRDATLYPQPTFFTIRLPRPFKSVKTINISQLNLLNSFFNFSETNGNTYMKVYEQGRTVNGTSESNIVNVKIRNGSYGVNDLVTELTNAMNATPLFADITLGNFINGFQATGDYTTLFNTPGTVVYNSLTQTYDRNQTITDIVGRYFQTVQTLGKTNFSYNECSVAYYYPIVKEMIIESNPAVPFETPASLPLGFASWYDYLVFAFTGLDDPYVTAIVTNATNQTTFNAYRSKNTFNNYLVNQYNCSYNAKQGRLNITAPNLNPSIQNDLTTQYNFYLNTLATQNGFTSVSDFQNQYAAISFSNSISIELYNFIQSRFTSNFAVNFGQYTANFYSDSNNEILIYNTTNRYGWNTSLSPSVSETSIDSNVLPAQISTFWKNILIDKTSIVQEDFISTLTVPGFVGGELAFSNAGESQLGYTDIVFTQKPTYYNRVAFTTRCRQNISVMALPRYIDNRDPSTNMVYNLGSTVTQTPLLFDTHTAGNTYILTDISGNLTFNMYTVEQNMFHSVYYMRSLNKWLTYMSPQILAGSRVQSYSPNFNKPPPASDISITSYRPYIFFQVNAAEYPVEPNARFNITFYVETQDGTNFPAPLTVTWYKDRAGFMADVALDLEGDLNSENPRHYFQRDTTSITTDVSGASMTVRVNNNQQTYFMIHAQSITGLPSSIPIRVFALLGLAAGVEPAEVYGDYTIATVEDRYDMPTSSIVGTLADQFTPYDSVYRDPTLSIYSTSVFQLGYDISGVSNNALDYIIQSQGFFNYDPNNISDYLSGTSTGLRYYVSLNNNGATQPAPTLSNTWSLYFGSNSSNAIFDSYNTANKVYLSSLQVPKPLEPGMGNESLLVNWFKPGAVLEFKEQFLYPNINSDYSTKISSSSVFLPCINTPTVPTDMAPPVFEDISGFCGMSFFLPPNQVLKLDSFLIKFAYTQPSANAANTLFTRTNSPLTLSNLEFNAALYRNQTTNIGTTNSAKADWDDWFLYNRRNTKLGVFRSSDINGANISTLELSTAVCTFTLDKITQVNNYESQLGTLRTREPEWGTYYTYRYEPTSRAVWDVSSVTWNNVPQDNWRSTITEPDFAPTYSAGNSTYPNYFLTPAEIYNYSYLPRTYGIAPSVGNASYDPTLVSTYTADIPNSFTMVPFFNDPATGRWSVGSFYGISYTNQPALPSTGIACAAPYAGPPGGYGWMAQGSTIQMVSSVGSLFYWNTKVQYETVDLRYDPATDLTRFGGFSGIQSEYQDTMLFFYQNQSVDEDYGDISTSKTVVATTNYWVWGQESNTRYHTYDDQGGYNLLSYSYNQSVRTTIPEYAVHLRAYDPIPEFTTGLRFIGKNYTDFGTPSLGEIVTEISSLAGYTPITGALAGTYIHNLYSTMTNGLPKYGPYTSTISTNNGIRFANNNYFSHEYADALITFDKTFSTSAVFGQRIGYTASNFTFTGYADCLNQYVTLFSSTQAALVLYTTILSSATGELNNYVVERYSNILPANVLSRNRITDPLPFQLLLSTPLVNPYKTQYDQWGLGWNLGFNKRDTEPSVSITSDTFIRIVQDYIYLQLNPEFNMNAIAVSGKEDKSMCLDSAGQESKYFSKIILNDFGSYCRTAVQMPISFNPVLGKYETLSCQLVDRNGNNISSVDCEYDFVLEVTEIVNGPADTESLLKTTADLDVYSKK